MIKKSYINPNLVKIFTYSLMAIILTTAVTIMTSYVLNKTMQKTEDEYYDSYNAIVSNSTALVSVALEAYKEELSIFNNQSILQNSSEKEIKEYIIACTPKLPKDFKNLLYISLDGKAFLNDGQEIQLIDRDYYYKDREDSRSGIIGDGIISSDGTDIYLFTITTPIFDESGKVKASLCAAIPVSVFENLFFK